MSTPLAADGRSRGSVTAVAICWVASIVGLAGLVVDGGRVVTAHVRAADRAAGAARMGAQQLESLRAGVPRIDCDRAVPVVRTVLAGSAPDSVRIRCDAGSLAVTVGVTVATPGLRLFGVVDRRVVVTREVRMVEG